MRKWVFLIGFWLVSLIAVWGYTTIKYGREKKEAIEKLEKGTPLKALLKDFGYILGIYATEKVVSQDLGALRFHINYLAREDKNIQLIMIVDKNDTVLLSTDVTQEGEDARDILGYDPMDVGKMAIEDKGDVLVLHIPLIKYSTKIGYVRIEYRK